MYTHEKFESNNRKMPITPEKNESNPNHISFSRENWQMRKWKLISAFKGQKSPNPEKTIKT